MIATGTRQCGVRKTWLAEIWDRLSTLLPLPASRSPSRSVKQVALASFPSQVLLAVAWEGSALVHPTSTINKTLAQQLIYLDVALHRPTLGTLRHRTPYYSSLVKTFPFRHTTRATTHPLTPSRAASRSRRAVQCNCALCAAPHQSKGAFQHLHPIHSTAHHRRPLPCPRSQGKPPVSAQ